MRTQDSMGCSLLQWFYASYREVILQLFQIYIFLLIGSISSAIITKPDQGRFLTHKAENTYEIVKMAKMVFVSSSKSQIDAYIFDILKRIRSINRGYIFTCYIKKGTMKYFLI